MATPLIRICQKRLRLPYRFSLVVVYIFFLLALGGFIRYVTPSVIGEANRFMINFEEVQQIIVEIELDIGIKYPGIKRPLHGHIRSLLDEETMADIDRELDYFRQEIQLSDAEPEQYGYSKNNTEDTQHKLDKYFDKEAELLINSLMSLQISKVREQLPRMINTLYHGSATMLLALLFSFLILFDSARLAEQVKSLHDSRLREFYQETAQPVIRFAYVVGRAIQAQAMIACVNTVLTLIGLLLLGIPSVTLLSLIVFVCSFIPVLGVFISTTPIVLFALNTGGLTLSMGVIFLVVIIHVVEAYLLNPMIYGKHLKLNPVLVLIILLVAYHTFGLWGMILGVPVAHYFIHDVFGVPLWDEKRLKPGIG